MNETILLIGHGSRHTAGNIEILQFGEQLRARRPDWDIDVCFIEFSNILVPEGLQRAAQKSKRVIAVPLILNAAGHVKMEVPAHIAHARQHFPHTDFVYARHLAASESILAVLRRRLQQAMLSLDMPDPRSTGLILLGRGASDRAANGEVAKMAR
ncbi:MAG: sirohydrochlorin chelatase, partial [Gammaproteobacteria bacterium]|nr:sirohydrochlorin chelatase [Gammaproteobacteria bacterium]